MEADAAHDPARRRLAAGGRATRTSATRPRTGSPRSRSTGPRCATRSGPQTLIEISDALERAREDLDVGVIVLTGEGPLAFCSGGDQRVRGDTGYVAERRRARRRPLPRDRPARPDAPLPEAGRGDGGRLRDRRRPRAARGLRPHDRRRQRALRPDRARRSAASTAASAPACSPTWSGRRRRRRSGSCAASTTPSRRSRWASSTRSCRSSSSRRRRSSGAARCSSCRRSRCAC